MNSADVLLSYSRYASFYDSLFGWTLAPGRKKALSSIDPANGPQILEIGIGTGLSLPLYPAGVQITGIDLSPPMLALARRKAERLRLSEVSLQVMDGQNLQFKENSFDQSLAIYVVSTAPNPAALVKEMRRVTKPEGRIYIVNHFSRKGSILRSVESLLSPLAPVLGFEPLFPLEKFLRETGMEDAKDIPIPPLGYWRLLEWVNRK